MQPTRVFCWQLPTVHAFMLSNSCTIWERSKFFSRFAWNRTHSLRCKLRVIWYNSRANFEICRDVWKTGYLCETDSLVTTLATSNVHRTTLVTLSTRSVDRKKYGLGNSARGKGSNSLLRLTVFAGLLAPSSREGWQFLPVSESRNDAQNGPIHWFPTPL